MFLAIQNNVILEVCDTREEAVSIIEIEKRKDMVSIVLKRKLRKLFMRDPSNIALHKYSIVEFVSEEEV